MRIILVGEVFVGTSLADVHVMRMSQGRGKPSPYAMGILDIGISDIWTGASPVPTENIL